MPHLGSLRQSYRGVDGSPLLPMLQSGQLVQLPPWNVNRQGGCCFKHEPLLATLHRVPFVLLR